MNIKKYNGYTGTVVYYQNWDDGSNKTIYKDPRKYPI